MTIPSAQVSSSGLRYRFKTASVIGDSATAIALWRAGGLGSATGVASDIARYNWFYLNNPQGLAKLGFATYDPDETTIGCIGIGARKFYLDGTEVSAGVLVDFVVSPKHRSVFPALLLQRDGRASALASMAAVYGLPGPKAVAVCKRLETHVSFELPRYVRVVRSAQYLERLAPRWLVAPFAALIDMLDRSAIGLQLLSVSLRGKWVESFDSRFDRLWDRIDKSAICLGDRKSEFLHWRYKQQPDRAYHVFVISHRDSEEIAMYFVCEAGNGGLKIKDFLTDESASAIKAGLLLLCQQARQMGMSFVEIQIAGSDAIKGALKGARFTPRSSCPFFAVVNEPFRSDVQAARWYITSADEDV